MTKPLVFDLKQHLLEWQRHVLPIFVVVASVGLVLFTILRARQTGARLPEEGLAPARIGLIDPAPGKAETFDAAFAPLSPRELALAPSALVFEAPLGRADLAFSRSPRVVAVADAHVLHADEGAEAGEKTLVLLHDRPEIGPVESVYRGLETLRVPVGALVRRGQVVGMAGEGGDGFGFELRRAGSLDSGAGRDGTTGSLGGEEILSAWRGRAEDRLSPPPEGEPLEPASLQLETAPAAAAAPPQ